MAIDLKKYQALQPFNNIWIYKTQDSWKDLEDKLGYNLTSEHFWTSPDGKKLYVLNTNGGYYIEEFIFTVPWEVHTLIHNQQVDLSVIDSNPNAIAFSNTGSKMYMVGDTGNRVYQFSLTEPWDISSLVYDDLSGYVGLEENTPTDVAFSNNGTIMYVSGFGSDAIHMYDLSEAWNVNTASYSSLSFNILTWEFSIEDISFDENGNKLYIIGTGGVDSVRMFNLSEAWNVATASHSYESRPCYVGGDGMGFSKNGKKLYILDMGQDTIVQHNLYEEYNLVERHIQPKTSKSLYGDWGTAPVYDFQFKPDGTKAYTLEYPNRIIYEYDLTTAWDVRTVEYTGRNYTMDIGNGTNPYSMWFKPDGTMFYCVTNSNDRVSQYSLSEAWNIQSASITTGTLNVSSEVGTPTGITFTPSGNTIYVIDNNTDTIFQYGLSEAWNVNTATLITQQFISGTVNFYDMDFNSDGTILYCMNISNQRIYQYGLSEAWNVNTATFQVDSGINKFNEIDTAFYSLYPKPDGKSFYLLGGGTSYMLAEVPTMEVANVKQTAFNHQNRYYTFFNGATGNGLLGFNFNDDGTKLYAIDEDTDTLFQYSLSKPYDLNTMTFDFLTYYYGGSTGDAYDIDFKPDGTLMYLSDISSGRVDQYELTEAWNVNTASYTTKNFSPGSGPLALRFKPDGESMYVLKNTPKEVWQYDLSEAWNVQTSSFSSSYYVGGISAYSMGFSTDGTRLFVNTDRITRQYNLSEAWNLATTTVTSKSMDENFIQNPYGMKFDNQGKTIFYASFTYNAITQRVLDEPWTLPEAPFKYYVGNRESTPYDLYIKPDGTKLYLVGSASDKVRQYTLSTPWDLTTISDDNLSHSVFSQDGAAVGLYFKPDGSKMYVSGTISDTVYQYNLSEAWNVNTATLATGTANVLSETSFPYSVRFNPDGTRMYILGTTEDNVFQYSLSEAWNVNTATLATGTLTTTTQEGNPYSIHLSEDGYYIYVAGISNDMIYKYSLSEAWNVNTASYTGDFLDVGEYAGNPTGLSIDSEGKNLFLIDQTNDYIFQLDISDSFNWFNPDTTDSTGSFTSTESTLHGALGNAPAGNATSYIQSAVLASGGSDTVDISVPGPSAEPVSKAGFRVNYTLQKPDAAWNVNTAIVTSRSFSTQPKIGVPTGLEFKPDGTKFYIIDNQYAYQYNLSEAWDVTTATLATGDHYFAFEDSTSYDICFKPDGTMLYRLGLNSDMVWQYSLSEAWNVNTATLATGTANVKSQDNSPTGLEFKPDGTVMYMLGFESNRVYQYDLSEAWNVNTATYASLSASVSEETAAYDLFFKPDGMRMFVVGTNNDRVYQYDLSEAWNVNTATLATGTANVKAEENSVRGLFFNPNGYYFYILGSDSDRIYEYSLLGAGTLNANVSLMEDDTVIQTWYHTNIANTLTSFSSYVTEANAKNIVDYSNLKVRIKPYVN